MSVIKLGSAGKHQAPSLESIQVKLDSEIRTQGSAFASSEDAGRVASLESLSSDQKQSTMRSLQEHAASLESHFQHEGISVTPSQLAAGAVIAMTAGQPASYQRQALKTTVVSQEGVNIVGADEGGVAGGYGFSDGLHSSLEAFDNSNLVDFVPMSIMYNIQAARQDAFAEAFFRTVTCTPENGGVDLSVRSQLVFNHFLHEVTGASADFKQRRLLEAAINHKILSDESTTLLPEVLEDDSNASYFVSPTAVAPRFVEMGNRTVRTAPLKIGQRVDLIGISQNNLMKKNGQADNTDSLDRTTGIKNVYMQLDGDDVLRFGVQNLPRSNFVKGPEGRNREQQLHFVTRSLQLNEKTLLADGSAPTSGTALDEIVQQKLIVNLSVTMTGQVDTEIGNLEVNAGRVTVHSVYNADGEKLSLTSGVGATIVAGLEGLVVIGFDPNARLSNANRRERGLQLNNQEYTERYPVPLGPPISTPSPLAENRDAGEINSLIAATRIRNSNNAVTKLINYADSLSSWIISEEMGVDQNDVPEIEGIARFLIRPWFRHTDLHLPDHINSLTSHERLADVAAVLVNAIRDGVYDAYRDSNIKTALDALTGYTGEKIKVLIGTDPVLSRYIMTQGDTRTLSDDLAYDKVSTMDARIRGQIYYTFVREGEGVDPLNFGSMLWIPELISHVQVSRGNSHIREAMVQPRARHVVHLPILGRISVTGLDFVVTGQTSVPVAVQP
jgi:hypothetical protein